MTPSRPALRYYGGKWRIAPWIIGYFPEHVCYVEPFGGGGSILWQKAPSSIEVYNDLDGEVVNFFRVLRERPEDLLRAIHLTPYSREEFQLAYEPTEDDVERARRLYVLSRQGRGSCRKQHNTGWRFEKVLSRGQGLPREWSQVDHLEDTVARLKQVMIERDDALAVIDRFDAPGTLFYVDPPYVHSTRGPSSLWEYQHEMSDDDHRRLAEALHGLKGMAIVSGYHSELYSEIFAGWRMVQRETTTDRGLAATECLWLSPSVDDRSQALRLPIGGA